MRKGTFKCSGSRGRNGKGGQRLRRNGHRWRRRSHCRGLVGFPIRAKQRKGGAFFGQRSAEYWSDRRGGQALMKKLYTMTTNVLTVRGLGFCPHSK